MNLFLNSNSLLRRDLAAGLVLWAAVWAGFLAVGRAAEAARDEVSPPPSGKAGASPADFRFFIRRFQIKGGRHLLPQVAVEKAVYPYLGPYRTSDDVERARAALEKAYRDEGYQTVAVQIPPQQVRGGVVVLQVAEEGVGRVRVNGSRYFSIDQIKKEAPSLQEGAVPNFNDVSRDLVALNRLPDRRITPTIRAGEAPGTVDIDLNVKDTPPVHGSLELNNRYSSDTSPLRLNGSVSYANLWQLGHTIGGGFQVAPENPSQVKVFSGYYLAPVPAVNGLSLMLQGTDQDSNVNTLGGIGVAGRGETVGARAIFTLPPRKDFYHSVSLGLDYKHYEQDVLISGTGSTTPITYYPVSVAYSGTWVGKGYETDLNGSVNFNMRGLGSSETQFDDNRHGANGSFVYFRGDASHTRDLPEGLQAAVKVQAQAADQPLVNSEQFSGGGLGSVRGYLESEELGDDALLGSAELRSPSLDAWLGKPVNEWRFYVFGEGGVLTVHSPLPEQAPSFSLASVGAGTRIQIKDHFHGSLDAGVPLIAGTRTSAYSTLFTFRLWAEF